MVKKWFSILLLLALILCLPLSAAASEISCVIDNASLISSGDEASLSQKIENLKETYHIDVVLLTVDSLDGQRPQNYANDYYDEHGYGEDGLLFLLSMEERDLYISTSGSMIYALTDYGIEQLIEAALPDFSAGSYYEGYNAFLDALPAYLAAQEDGAPIDGYASADGNYYHGDQETVVHQKSRRSPNLLLSAVIGLAAAGVSIWGMCSIMNTRRQQNSAGDYIMPGSFHLRAHQDFFLYSSITKTARPKETESSKSGGGSSVHQGSSGRSHGGGGGKF